MKNAIGTQQLYEKENTLEKPTMVHLRISAGKSEADSDGDFLMRKYGNQVGK